MTCGSCECGGVALCCPPPRWVYGVYFGAGIGVLGGVGG
jgi:hypothetical protein